MFSFNNERKHQEMLETFKQTSSILAEESRLDRESREKIAREQIKALDRVNISLEEYESIKRKIASQERIIDNLSERIKRLSETLPYLTEVIKYAPDMKSLIVEKDRDLCTGKRFCKIYFKYDGYETIETISESEVLRGYK